MSIKRTHFEKNKCLPISQQTDSVSHLTFLLPFLLLFLLPVLCDAQEPVGRWLLNGNGHHISNPALNAVAVDSVYHEEGIDGISLGSAHTNPGYYEIPYGTLENSGSMSVSIWWKGKSNNETASSAIGRAGLAPNRGWGFGPDNNGRVHFAVSINSNTNAGLDLYNVSDDKVWEHWVGIYDADNQILKMYKNGLFMGSKTDGVPSSQYLNSLPIAIGHRGDQLSSFSGNIDNVRIYDRVISEQEIMDIYNEEQQVSPCANGIMDGDETGIDCGGSFCPPCELGKWEFSQISRTLYDPVYRFGSVAIGLKDPGAYKLAVDGTIVSKELEVAPQGWSDYVFDADYQLMPLPILSEYIKTYGKLPDIPSAEEVWDKGIAVGEMQKKLLAKIEELTLYILKQDQLIAEQNKRLVKLEKLILDH